jgi:hypothetical protein
MEKLIALLLVLGFVVLYLIGIKAFWSRLVALLVLLLSLGIVIPNLTVDEAGFIVRHVDRFTEHVASLLQKGDSLAAQAKLARFNAGFPGVSRDMAARPRFIRELIDSTNSVTHKEDGEHGVPPYRR